MVRCALSRAVRSRMAGVTFLRSSLHDKFAAHLRATRALEANSDSERKLIWMVRIVLFKRGNRYAQESDGLRHRKLRSE
jgi:hypothetical protein